MQFRICCQIWWRTWGEYFRDEHFWSIMQHQKCSSLFLTAHTIYMEHAQGNVFLSLIKSWTYVLACIQIKESYIGYLWLSQYWLWPRNFFNSNRGLKHDTSSFHSSTKLWGNDKSVVKDLLVTNKSPCPHGFNDDFLKKCWHINIEDFYKLCEPFHRVNICVQSIHKKFPYLMC